MNFRKISLIVLLCCISGITHCFSMRLLRSCFGNRSVKSVSLVPIVPMGLVVPNESSDLPDLSRSGSSSSDASSAVSDCEKCEVIKILIMRVRKFAKYPRLNTVLKKELADLYDALLRFNTSWSVKLGRAAAGNILHITINLCDEAQLELVVPAVYHPLHHIAQGDECRGCFEYLQEHLEEWLDSIDLHDVDGHTPLLHALHANNRDIAILLLDADGMGYCTCCDVHAKWVDLLRHKAQRGNDHVYWGCYAVLSAIIDQQKALAVMDSEHEAQLDILCCDLEVAATTTWSEYQSV